MLEEIKKRLLTCLCIVVFGLAPCGQILAQTVTGTISGTVVDSSGAVIAGTTVKLSNEQTGNARTLKSNSEGRFSFAAIQPGTYTLRVEEPGFQTLERKNIVLSANEVLALGSMELKAGQVTETVTVTTQGDRVETETSDLTARLTSDQISLISTKGRDITSLLRLIPGTSNNDDIEAVGEGFGTDLPNISGQRGRSTVATVDGLNASEPSGSNKISMTTNQDAIAEVKVLRNNYAAEYGNNGGAIINIVSKGGRKEYAGSAYYFVRNEAFNATPFFTNKAELPKPLYRHNIWGFTVGGPVQVPKLFPNKEKDRLFFFFSLEKPHTITPTNPVFVTMPTELERQGNFSQSFDNTGKAVVINDPTTGQPFHGNIIPANRINKSGQALLNFFPLPNTPGGRTLLGAAYNYINQKSVNVPKHSYVIRFDARPSSKDSVYWKGQWWTSDNEGLGTSGWPGGDNNRWGISSHYLYTDNGWSTNWVHIFNPSIVNEFNFGMRKDTEGFVPSDGVIDTLTRSALDYAAPQLFSDNNTLGLIPRVTGWSSVAGTAANINWLDRWGEVGADHIQPSFADNLTINRGNHSYKFGAYFERLLNREAPGGNWSGTFNFGTSSSFTTSLGNTSYAYANALLGNFNSYSEQSGRPFTNNAIQLFQWYAQDQWRVSRRVTLNYGLRLGYHTPFYQRDEQGSDFDPSRFDPAKAPLLYLPFCVNGTPSPGSCPGSRRRAMDPRTGQLFTSTNLVGTFVPGTGDPANGMILGSDPSSPRGFRQTAPVDVEPRIGLAWDVTGRGKTVLRLMGGVYHAPRVGGGTGGASSLGGNPPLQRTFTVNFGNIDNLVDLVGTALNGPSTVSAVEISSNTPTTYNFTLGIQQDIGLKTVLEVSYVGSVSRHLGERRNINQVPDTAKWIDVHPENRNPFSSVTSNGSHLVGALADNFLRPYRGYGTINLTTWSGVSNYNALQVQLNRRYTRGFQYGVAYTWSKTLDYANDDNVDVNDGRPYRAFNYGPANFDQTHIFAVNYIYDVPNLGQRVNNRLVKAVFDGWQLSGITTFVTGKPKGLSWSFAGTGSATNTTDFTGGSINARPNVVFACNPNKPTGGSDPTGTAYVINPACFAKPLVSGDIGNLPRNIVRLPSIFNTDLALFKNVHLGEKRTFQFRWETYNLFNRANFSDIDGALTFDANGVQTNTRFGTPTKARSPRVMQGSLRINF